MSVVKRTGNAWTRLCYSVGANLIDFYDKLKYYTLYKESGRKRPVSFKKLKENELDIEYRENHDEIVAEYLKIEQELGIKLSYRDEQASYSQEIMDAIKNNIILLIQAGVGTGKTYGYLIPIMLTYKNDHSFSKAIISTASIALQEQLIKDINNVSKMLGIDIKVGIAKGINNYACLRKIDEQLKSPHMNMDSEEYKTLNKLMNEIIKKSTSDKSELTKMSDAIWEKVRLQNRGACSNCSYSTRCPYYKLSEELPNYNIIVTNHGNYIRNIMDDTQLVKDANIVVFDEAHKLEEYFQSIREQELKLEDINDLIEKASALLNGYGIKALLFSISKVFSRARASGSANFFDISEKRGTKGKYSIVESNRLKFEITKTVAEWLDIAIEELNKLLKEMHSSSTTYKRVAENTNSTQKFKILSDKAEKLDKLIVKIARILTIFKDMKKDYSTNKKSLEGKEESSNIYWASFYQNDRITIRFTPKNNLDLVNKLFSGENPYILTSATMGTYYNAENSVNDNEKEMTKRQPYKPIVYGLGLDKIDRASDLTYREEFSPYFYDNQVLLYYDDTISKPNESDEYIDELAEKIDEAMRITEGKALVLFTSKKTMYLVYKKLIETKSYPFELLLQTDDNSSEVKEKFASDINSCLFATGAFWEGIDIKGPALSNLIITHLPFDQVDAVNQYEASKYSTEKEKMQEIYLPKMLLKFKQGYGRLIRSSEDRGIVFCLDPRIKSYLDEISEATEIPIVRFKTDLSSVKRFYEYIIAPRLTNTPQKELTRLEIEYHLLEPKAMSEDEKRRTK